MMVIGDWKAQAPLQNNGIFPFCSVSTEMPEKSTADIWVASSINSAPSAYWARRKKKTGAPSAMRSRRAVAASAASQAELRYPRAGGQTLRFHLLGKADQTWQFPREGQLFHKSAAPGVRFKIPCSTKFSSALRTR